MAIRGRRGLWPARLMALAMVAAIAVPFVTGSSVSATSGLFAPYQSIALGSDTQAVAIGDVTGDGRADVIATGSQSFADYRIYVLAGQPDGTLAAPISYVTVGSGSHPLQSVAVGDITGDGRAEVIIAASSLGIQIFPQLADGTLGAPTLIDTPDSLKVRTGEFDGQPGLDLAAIGWGTGTLSVFLNDGQGHLSAPVVYAVKHDGYDDLEVGDVVRDGRDDIVVMSGQGYATPNVSVVPQLAGGGFGPPSEYRVGDQVNSNGIGIGDVTGDGRADVVAAYGGNSPTGRLAVFAQTSGGSLAAPVSYPSYDIPTPVEIADLNRDGWADVVTLHSGWAKAGIYRSIGDGSLALEELDSLPGNSSYDPHGLAVGDVTGDGWPDLVIAAPMTGVVILRNIHPSDPGPSPSDSFSPPPSASPAPTPTAAPTPTPAPTATPKPTPSPTPPPQLPSAPTNLTTSPNLPSGVGLSWAAPASSGTGPVTGYRIYRGPFINDQTPLVTVGNVLSFIDTTVQPGTTVFYSVAALSVYGEGSRSAAVAAQRALPPSAPASLTASVGKGISLSWTAPSNGGTPITAYRIYRGTSSGGETFLVSVGAGVTSYTDAGVAKKTRYFYRVTAVNVIGEGPPSAEVNATSR